MAETQCVPAVSFCTGCGVRGQRAPGDHKPDTAKPQRATMWTSKRNCRQDSNPRDVIVDGKGSRRIKAIRAARRCQAIELLDRQSVEPSSACWSLCSSPSSTQKIVTNF